MTIEVQMIDGEICNKQGFPLDECSRCGATGHYSFNTVTGSRCFNCNGSGYTVQKRAESAWSAMLAEIDSHRRCTVRNMNVGDLIAYKRVWREVVSIEITDQSCGSFKVSGCDEVFQYYRIVKFTDGTQDRLAENEIFRRSYKIDVPKYLAMVKPARKKKEVG
jgi:DnaJ-class molecular chaperone